MVARAQPPFVRQGACDCARAGAVVTDGRAATLHVSEHVHRGHTHDDLAHRVATEPRARHQHALARHEAAVDRGVGDTQEGGRERRVLHDHAFQIGRAVVFATEQRQHLARDDRERTNLAAQQHRARQAVRRHPGVVRGMLVAVPELVLNDFAGQFVHDSRYGPKR